MTGSTQPDGRQMPVFGDTELVFAAHPDRIPGVNGPVFGRSDEWPADAIRRPSNKPPGAWKLRFPGEAAWSLRARETSFALLNPTHRALREAGVHLPAQPAALGTLVQLCHHLTMVMRWAGQHALPADLPSWTSTHWDAFLEETSARVGPSSVTGYVSSIRRLVVLAPVLTGGGPGEDPWPNRTAADVGRRASRAVSTPAIPPATWWPLLRAAWTYIDVFAGDLLDLRDRAAAARADRVPGSQASARYDQLVIGWLAEPANLVPVHAAAWRDVPAGAPRWTALSLLITGGATDSIFAAGHRRGAVRRALIEAAAAQGRIQPLNNGQALPGAAAAKNPPHRTRGAAVIDADLRRWLADPASRIPVRGRDHRNGAAGTVLWATLARLIYPGHRSSHIFEGAAGQRRRDLVTAAATWSPPPQPGACTSPGARPTLPSGGWIAPALPS